MSLADVTDEDFVPCIYSKDDGTNCTVKLKRYRQVAGGFEVGVVGSARPNTLEMRQVHFVHPPTGRRTSLPWAEVDAQFYDPTLTISIDGVAGWEATGRTGEKETYVR